MNAWQKIGSVAGLLGSIYALVWFKNLDVSVFVGLASSALASLGVHAAATGLSATPVAPTAPKP